MKRFLRVLLVLVLLLVLFRGPVYRLLTDYEITDYRPVPLPPDERLQTVSDSLYLLDTEPIGFVRNVQHYVAGRLRFRAHNSGTTAAALHAGGEANCVGYARLTADLLNRNRSFTGQDYLARQGVAKISVLGFDLHRLFDSPFFRDHDVVVIQNKEGTIVRVVDPSLFDYAGVRWVE